MRVGDTIKRHDQEDMIDADKLIQAFESERDAEEKRNPKERTCVMCGKKVLSYVFNRSAGRITCLDCTRMEVKDEHSRI